MSDFATLVLAADSRGLVSGEQALDRFASTAEKTESRTGKALESVGKSAEQLGKQSIFAGQQMRLASLQLSQIAQQASATGNVLQAIAIQLPDLALGLSTYGILAGAAAGALLPLAANFLTAKEGADDFDDALKRVKDTAAALQESADILGLNIDELAEKYGQAAQRVYEFSLAQAQIRVGEAQRALEEQSNSLEGLLEQYITSSEEGRRYESTIGRISEAFGVNRQEADALENAFRDLYLADGFSEQQSALESLISLLNKYGVDLKDLPPEFAAAADKMIQLSNETDAAAQIAAQLNGIVAQLSGSYSSAADEAGRLAAALPQGSGQRGDPREFENDPYWKNKYFPSPEKPVDKPRSGGGGRRGGRSYEIDQAERERKAVGDLIAELQEELSLVNASETAKRSAAAVRQAGAAATEQERQTIASLIEQIDAEQQARDRLADQIDFEKDLTHSAIDGVKSALDDGKITWKEWGEIGLNVLDKVSDKLLSDVLDSIFTVNKAAAGSGQSIFGSLFSSLFGGGNTGFAALPAVGPVPTARPSFEGGGYTGSGSRSGGLDGKGGFMALLHPDETVIDHTRTSNSRTSAPDGGRSVVEVRLSPDLESRILEKAGNQTVAVVRQTVEARENRYQNGADR